MTHPNIIQNIDLCKKQIEEDFEVNLFENLDSKKIMLRGENKFFSYDRKFSQTISYR